MNNPFTFEELQLLQLYKADNRVELIHTLQDIAPLVTDDSDISSLLASSIQKLESISDIDFSAIDFDTYSITEEDLTDE